MIPSLRFVPSTNAAAPIVAAARSDGALVHRIGAEDLGDADRARAALARSLAFPSWSGSNWDAVADCLIDLSWLDPAPRLIVLDGLPASAPGTAWTATLLEILLGAVRYWTRPGVPPLGVVVVTPPEPRGAGR
ncbi:MAG: barstar family protein [Acidimicrobiia bacterium]|nr:barstar family protein [Acidimicrobiia bacterium]